MPLDLVALLKLNREVRAELERRAAKNDEREARLRRELEDCEQERRQIEVDRAALDRTEGIYRRRLGQGTAGAAEPEPAEERSPKPEGSADGHDCDSSEHKTKQPKARIGPQRYLMWVSIRESGPSLPEEVAARTRLPLRRVRDQLAADTAHGFFDSSESRYGLTAGGMSLLARFENYKKSRGEKLPTLDDAAGDGDTDDGEAEDVRPDEETSYSGAPY